MNLHPKKLGLGFREKQAVWDCFNILVYISYNKLVDFLSPHY